MDFSEFHSAEFQQFVQDHLQDDPVQIRLKYHGKVNFDLQAAVQQIAARKSLKRKLPEWTANPSIFFPGTIPLEQSSSELTAHFKAQKLSGKNMLDLTGGLGVDSYYLSKGFEKAVYCEQQDELFEITRHNLEQLAPRKFDFHLGDGLEFLEKSEESFDLIYADPARRGKGNQKLYKLEDCEPNLVEAWKLLTSKASKILLKYSPMLDVTQVWKTFPEIQKITVVSVKNEVKELLLHWSKSDEIAAKKIEVYDLESGYPPFLFYQDEEEQAVSDFGEPENYLIEPISGILKAGAFKLFGERFSLKKLESNSHLYTSSNQPQNIPGKVFEIIEEVSPRKKDIQKIIPNGKANVLTRNYSLGAEELRKKLGLKDGGEEYLIGTKTLKGYQVFRCKRIVE
ncbi:class I SAM-dependent methyltransferase [Algoriphagus limi]|uniref:Class I SAM-dependent methyltransferase n=1 Tax=Algoriphagus limi TaxID=2975273 RepID=A0ABT2G864_9BACT|nr:class I SAM-dependent methyltransferase [Algoriphagus limi]MCS5491454.1 class I SAM-dependent methyltransferase [Algoriphagus limi]